LNGDYRLLATRANLGFLRTQAERIDPRLIDRLATRDKSRPRASIS
jgi:hypothetical protein